MTRLELLLGRGGNLSLVALAFCLVGLATASAQDEVVTKVVPKSAAAIKQSFAPVVKRAAPAVVNVYVRHKVKQSVSPFFNDPFFRRFFGDQFGVPRERIQNSLGLGRARRRRRAWWSPTTTSSVAAGNRRSRWR